jgi:hypothetical protein
MKELFGSLAVLTFSANVAFNNVDESGAWTTVRDVNGVVFWVALGAFLVMLLIDRRQARPI